MVFTPASNHTQKSIDKVLNRTFKINIFSSQILFTFVNRMVLLATLATTLMHSSAFASNQIIHKHLQPTIEDGFDRTGLVIIGSGIALTFLSQSYDYQMRDAWINHQRMNESTSRVGDLLGTGIPGVTIALSQFFWFDKEGGIAHAEALLDTFLVTSLIKQTSQRARPSSDNHYSMPSGHTSTTFATATSLTYSYGWKVAVPAYLVAGFTAASRWADDAHWFSDTVAGAFVGYFWGRATWFHHGRLTPIADTKSLGLIWHTEF